MRVEGKHTERRDMWESDLEDLRVSIMMVVQGKGSQMAVGIEGIGLTVRGT